MRKSACACWLALAAVLSAANPESADRPWSAHLDSQCRILRHSIMASIISGGRSILRPPIFLPDPCHRRQPLQALRQWRDGEAWVRRAATFIIGATSRWTSRGISTPEKTFWPRWSGIFGQHAPEAQITSQTGLLVEGDGAAERIADTGKQWKGIRDEAYPAGDAPSGDDAVLLCDWPGDRVDASRIRGAGSGPGLRRFRLETGRGRERRPRRAIPRMVESLDLTPRSIPAVELTPQSLTVVRKSDAIPALFRRPFHRAGALPRPPCYSTRHSSPPPIRS